MTADPGPDKPEIPLAIPLRPDVASLFASIDPNSPEAVTKLCDLLFDPNPAHRRWAADMLTQMGSGIAEWALPLLAELLKHPTVATRQKAAEVLSCFGPQAEPALAGLQAALRDKDDHVQRWSARALGEIGPPARAALADLLQLRFNAPDVKTAAVAAVAIRRIDAETGATGVITSEGTGPGVRCIFFAHRSCVQCVAFSPDGRLAVTGSGQPATGGDADFSIRLWDLEARRERAILKGHTDRVTAVAFVPDGKRLVSSSYDGTVRVWEVEQGWEQLCLAGHQDRVRCVAAAPDGRSALSGGCDQTLRGWDLETGRETPRFRKQRQWVISLAYSADGSEAFSAGPDGLIHRWNPRSGREIGGSWFDGITSLFQRGEPSGQGQGPTATTVAFSPDGRRALIASTDRKLRLHDLQTRKDVSEFRGHTAAVMCVVFSADGKRALSGGMDQTLRLWDVATAAELQKFEGHTDVVMAVALSADGRFALSGGADRTVRLWQLPE